MKKNIVLIIMLVLLIGLSGFILYDKILSNDSIYPTKEKIDPKELEVIEEFINKADNNAFILMNYSNIQDIFTEKNYNILKYSINSSGYSRPATNDEIESIKTSEEIEVSIRVASAQNIKSYIKEKTNYDLLEDDIKTSLNKYLNKKLNLFNYFISDEIFEKHDIVYGYKIGNKYYLILDDNSEVVLTKEDGNYYFESSNNIELGQTIDK